MVVFVFVTLGVECPSSVSVVVFVAEVDVEGWRSKEGESGRMNWGAKEVFF